MITPLPPQYQPAGLEAELYRRWEAAGLFRPDPDAPGAPFVVMMPPPNVTANLHMGHGLNNTLQDVLIRFERMRGRQALWLPGTDHAGIATQNVVERLLKADGQTRFDLGREAFEARVRTHVEETGDTILRQLRAIGASCDWDRSYFTLEPRMSRAVREAFVRLHERGLVYRGTYIINWCPRCLTALSNEEVEKVETDGRLWRFRYPRADGRGHVTVATTRPETMLGDTGVAVHPDDPRYRELIGQTVQLPLTDRRIPVVADAAVDPAFGTGAVKVTPAHDPVDLEIGRRQGLAELDIMTDDARMNGAVPGPYRGLDRFEARRRVVAAIEALGLLEGVEPHRHAVGHCYRCDTVVEPRLSEQWFVRMAPLAAPALEAWRTGRVRFVPAHRGEEFEQWLTGIRDWCISRQLWWGHRIPVWYCEREGCGGAHVSRTDLTTCPGCGGPVRQDDDVLDTWFSSWLVPFSALGWPDRTADLARFYPGHTLVTAPEILFFWVARMIMAGLEFMDEVPFELVYLHGTVRDTQHRKMSKSLGNGIDPFEVVDRFGADALRYTVVSGMAVGTDLILDPDDLETSFGPARNFANKLWNATRFALQHLADMPRPLFEGPRAIRPAELTLADRWILARCDAAIREATANYERLRLNEAAHAIYHFLWSDLADWYIELAKPRLHGSEPGGEAARAVLLQTLDAALRLLHPIMPFITEALWQRLPGRPSGWSLTQAPWPCADDRAADPAALAAFAEVQALVSAVRGIRAEHGVAPGQTVRARLDRASAAITTERATVLRLARLSELSIGPADEQPGAHAVLPDGTDLFVPLGDLVDLGRERERLGSERERLRGLVAGQEHKLANAQFIGRAPAEVVQRERDKLAGWQDQVAALEAKLARLG